MPEASWVNLRQFASYHCSGMDMTPSCSLNSSAWASVAMWPRWEVIVQPAMEMPLFLGKTWPLLALTAEFLCLWV